MTAPVTSKNMIMTMENSSVTTNYFISVSVRYELTKALAATMMITSPQRAVIEKKRTADISINWKSDIRILNCTRLQGLVNAAVADERMPCTIWWTDQNPDQKLEPYNMRTTEYGTASLEFNVALEPIECTDDGIEQRIIEMTRSVPLNIDCSETEISVSYAPTRELCDDQLTCLTTEVGFRLQKWLDFECNVLESIEPSEQTGTAKEITDDTTIPCERTLGAMKNVERDGYVVDADLRAKPAELPVTKRTILSVAATLFYIVGFVALVNLMPKLMIQELCREHLEWDDEAPEKIKEQWKNWNWLYELPALKIICVPRCFKPQKLCDGFATKLYHLLDASEKGYGAVTYQKITDKDGRIRISFVMGKLRLAPLKPMTIPRLELCGAVLAARLHDVFMRETDLKIDEVFWCDSLSVLGYIRNATSRYKSFVANRLAMIHDLIEVHRWHHIDGSQFLRTWLLVDVAQMMKIFSNCCSTDQNA